MIVYQPLYVQQAPKFHLKSAKAQVSHLQAKISKVAFAIFKGVRHVVIFPLRYFGSKSWSIPGVICRLPYAIFKRIFKLPCEFTLKEELFGKGYNFGFEKDFTKEKFKPYFPMVAMGAYMHSTSPHWVEPLGYKPICPLEFGINSGSLEKKERCFFDPATGLKIAAIEKGDEIMIGFGALGSSQSELPGQDKQNKDIEKSIKRNVYKSFLGGSPKLYHQADQFIEDLLKSPRFEGKKVVLISQCVGGSLASYVALKQKLQAQCVNTLPIGVGLQNEIGRKNLMHADKYVTHISVRGDWTTDWRNMNRIDRVVSALGIRTIGNFGRRYLIPTAYKSFSVTMGGCSMESHTHAIKSAIVFLGYDRKAKVADVAQAFA